MEQSVNELIKFFISQKTVKVKDGSISYIHTHEAISRLARFYEALRNAVDLKEEHLLRRNAIERILKRLIIIEDMTRENMGKEMIIELIRGGYLSNDTLPETKITEFEKIIGKYVRIIQELKEPDSLKAKLKNWLISVASVEIEEKLNPEQLFLEQILSGMAFKRLLPILKIKGVSEIEIKTQLFIAILKTIFKADEAVLRLRLLDAHIQGFSLENPESVNYLAKYIAGLSLTIEKEIKNKLNIRFGRYVKKFAPIFWVFRDYIKETVALTSLEISNSENNSDKSQNNVKFTTEFEENSEKILNKIKDEEHLTKTINRICERKYFEAKARLRRTIKKSIIFLLFTKTILAFTLELPYGLYILKKINHFSLFINVVFHPLLLAVIAIMIKTPGKENTDEIIKGAKELLNPFAPADVFKPQNIIQRSSLTNFVLNFIYTSFSLLIFTFIIIGLNKIHFNIVSIALFCFFLSLVSFLGWKSRQTVQEMFVLTPKEKLPSLLLDFFALPIISIGGWLIKKMPKFNIFTIILDFIIEAPFQIIIGGLESWAKFAREKREEIEI